MGTHKRELETHYEKEKERKKEKERERNNSYKESITKLKETASLLKQWLYINLMQHLKKH